MEEPFIRVEDTGELFALKSDVTTIGRGQAVDVRLTDPSVSRLHAEIIRRGPYVYVVDLGLSRNGTRVNGRPVARRILEDGDVVSFGSARCRAGGIPHEDLAPEAELRRSATPELTRRELDVLTSLCRPALSDEAFVAPATAREIAADLVVTEAAVKQHLLRLYQKFRIPEGPNRRTRLANEVVALGLVRPLPATGAAKPEPAWPGSGPGGSGPAGGAGSGSAGAGSGQVATHGGPAGPQARGAGPASPPAGSRRRAGDGPSGTGPPGNQGPPGTAPRAADAGSTSRRIRSPGAASQAVRPSRTSGQVASRRAS